VIKKKKKWEETKKEKRKKKKKRGCKEGYQCLGLHCIWIARSCRPSSQEWNTKKRN